MYEKLLKQLKMWSQRELRKITEKRVIKSVKFVTHSLNASQYIQLAEDCNGIAYLDVVHFGKAGDSSDKIIIDREVITLGFFGEIRPKDSERLLRSFDVALTNRLYSHKLTDVESLVAGTML